MRHASGKADPTEAASHDRFGLKSGKFCPVIRSLGQVCGFRPQVTVPVTLVTASTFSAIDSNFFDDVKEWSGPFF